jgi:hypothetical protein
VTEAQVLDHVAEFFASLGLDHAMLRQVPVGDRRLDALIVTSGPSIAIEAKTSRADFRRETDQKRSAAWEIAEVCMYAAPAGVIHPDTLPTGWGLIEVPDGRGTPAVLVPGERHELVMPMDRLHDTLLRRCARHEDALRAPTTPETERVALLDQIARLEETLARQADVVRRERDRAQHAAEQVLAQVGDQVCSACEQPITYARVGGWRHVDRALDEPCRARRQETERVRRESTYGVRYIASYTPPVVPLALAADPPDAEVSTGH